MADDKDLKKMLDDWETRLASDSKLVDQLNEYRKAAYDGLGTPAKDRSLIATDEETRKTYAAAVRKATEDAIKSSPQLKADFIQEIGEGRIKKLEMGTRDMAAAGAYEAGKETMYIDPMTALIASQRSQDSKKFDPMFRELIGVIGHELDHSQQRTKGMAEDNAFKTEAEKILNDGKQSHDYTKVIGDQLAARGASESRAQLDYYNSIVLSLSEKDRTEAKIFAAIPQDRKADFFDIGKGKMLPGLSIDPPGSGLLPQTADNIKALEKSFFERPQFGPSNLETYKHQIAANLVASICSVDAAKDITINFKAMGVDYNAIQPYLKDIAPAKTIYDNSDGTKLKLETDKQMTVAPAQAEPKTSEPAKQAEKTPSPDDGGKQKLPEAAAMIDGDSEHPLYAQALRHLKSLGPISGGYADPMEMQRIAGALADAAQQRHLHGIESIAPSLDGKGLIASWSNPGNPDDSDRVYLDKTQAATQPLEQSLQRLKSNGMEAQLEPTQPQHVTSHGFGR